MEINIKNIFSIAVQISLAPWFSTYNILKDKVQAVGYITIHILLQMPFSTTMLVSTLAVFFIVFASLFLIALVGTFCLVTFIIMIEGYAVLIAMLAINLLMATLFLLALGAVGIKLIIHWLQVTYRSKHDSYIDTN